MTIEELRDECFRAIRQSGGTLSREYPFLILKLPYPGSKTPPRRVNVIGEVQGEVFGDMAIDSDLRQRVLTVRVCCFDLMAWLVVNNYAELQIEELGAPKSNDVG